MSAHRHSPNGVAGLLIVAGLTLGAVTVEAKGKDSAQALLNRGNAAFAAGNYPAALEAFQKGNEVSPSPVFQRSIGYSYLKMYQHEKARAILQEYLKKYPKQTDLKKIQDLVGGLDVVVQTKISVTSKPPGAELYIDAVAGGKVGTTPFTGTIEPGKHLVILKLGEYHTTVRPFTISPKQAMALEVPMEALLEVESTPSGADVYIDSEKGPPAGKTKLATGIGPGKHQIIIKLAGYKTKVESVDVAPPKAVSISATLPLGIRVVSNPPGAKVELNGKLLEGVTPIEESVTPGQYKVTVSLAGYKSYNATKTVAAGSDNTIEARLVGGLLTMRSDVQGAKVQVDGRELGSTPTEKASVPFGRHEVKVSHPDRRSWSSAVEFDEGQMVDAEVKLARPSWPIWVAGGVALVGTILGITGYVLARNAVNDVGPSGGCAGWDSPNDPAKYNAGHKGSCAPGVAHMGTAGATIAGTSAGVGLLYWLIWGRNRVEVRKVPVSTAAEPRHPTRTAAKAAPAAQH